MGMSARGEEEEEEEEETYLRALLKAQSVVITIMRL